jgi:hypothetical protein
MTPKPTRGGARAGSGRKRRITPRVPITVRLEPQDAERLRELCRTAGCSQADWIARAVNGSSMTFAEWYESAAGCSLERAKRAECYDLAMMELAFNFQPKTSTPKPPPEQQA